ncbi:hypothetical protein DFJ74DRAFT_694481 [Hyaloraphidium curvatum]|nr:hypothetical protein DFJ74DRAFT_694481 [Hyaloraphidium curvatum]
MAAVNGVNGTSSAGSAQAANGHAVEQTGPKVIIIGAGVNGIQAAWYLMNKSRHYNFEILERAEDFGGTWWNVRYPGLSCDIPAVLYQWSWEPNPDWSRPYPFREELLEYILRVAKKHDLYRYTRFNTAVRSMVWDEAAQLWRLKLAKYAGPNSDEFVEEDVTAHIVMDCHKVTNEPGFPDVPGAGWNEDETYYRRNKDVQPLGAFKGKVMHSSVYDMDYDLTGKRVAVIGCAAAGMQIVQTIAPKCGHLYVYHRTPEWILPRNDEPYTEEQKKFWRENPMDYAFYRGRFNREFFDLWWGAMYRADSPQSKRTREMVLENMHAHIKDPKMREILTPTYPPWARRVLVSSVFYPTLMRDNVTLVHERLLRITDKAVVSNTEDPIKSAVPAGAPVPPVDPAAEVREREVDVIIYATGWAQGMEALKRMFPIVGKGGVEMRMKFFELGEPQNYMGTHIDGYPNYIMVGGAIPADTFQRAGEICLDYFVQLFDRMLRDNIASIDVTREAVAKFAAMSAKAGEGMAMLTPGVKSYYKVYRKDGSYKLFGFFPSTDDEMQVMFKHPFWENYVLEYRKEPWGVESKLRT